MKQHSSTPLCIEDGFDRQNLNTIRKRFELVNKDRLLRMHQALAPKHQAAIDALPILFHFNHPMLPGFVNRQTPSKISSFKPEKKALLAAKSLARSFRQNLDPSTEESIYGIYIMGSVGTIAQSSRSDIDVWLCHKPGMRRSERQQLQEKCERITKWAEEERLEMHFFLMDYEAFKAGKVSNLDSESSGSAQRLLLLDEFYRSAIFIAGRVPLWWLVPPQNEKNYPAHTHTLLGQRFVMPHHVLDFGDIAHIPPSEFIGAGVWQLYKAIESPYKSVLKLLLLEAYLSEYPNITPLSLAFKQRIFEGELDIDKLDAYVMVYERIEAYLLKQGNAKRLELARRCFYFKVNCALSRRTSNSSPRWRREVVTELVSKWQWTTDEIRMLDNRRNWKVATVASERILLVNELNHSYQFLIEFAQAQNIKRSISTEELSVLGRKLQAAFERRQGKIEWINPNISNDISEDTVVIDCSLGENKHPDIWTAYTPTPSSTGKQLEPIRSCTSFTELMLWSHYNGIVERHTRLDLSEAKGITMSRARTLLSKLEKWLPERKPTASHDAFSRSAQPTRALLLVYLSATTRAQTHYDEYEEPTIHSVDLVLQNSWQELQVRHFEKSAALLDSLKEYLQLTLPGTHHSPPKLSVECISDQPARNASQRITERFAEINRCFYGKTGSNQRYVFPFQGHYQLIQFIGKRPTIRPYNSKAELLASLKETQAEYSAIAISKDCVKLGLIRLLSSKMRRNSVSVFYRRFDIGMETWVIDEKGSLFHFTDRGKRKHNTMVPLHRFLRSVINRQALTQPELLADFGICPIYFYELETLANKSLHAHKSTIPQNSRQTSIFEVKAIAFSDDQQLIQYDFYCDDQEFSARSFHDQLYLVVAQFILSRRERGENYPIYITDLDLSLCPDLITNNEALQVSHYLKVKHELEAKLNEAIGVLAKA